MSDDWRGKIGAIERADMDTFLEEGVLCRLAVLDGEGWPYVVPVWFEWNPDEQYFWVIPREKSAWATYMEKDPRVALTIDTSEPPYVKIVAQGRAELVETPNVGGKWVEIATRMSRRYLGEHGPDYLEPTLNKPRWLFRIWPTKLITWQGVEWHPRYKASGT